MSSQENKFGTAPQVAVRINRDFKSRPRPRSRVLMNGKSIGFGKVLFFIVSILFLIMGIVGIVALVYLSTGISITFDNIMSLFEIGLMAFIFFPLGIYFTLGVISLKDARLYEDGIVPVRKKIKEIFSPEYFIPFEDILRIGRVMFDGDDFSDYYFLMRDGRIAHCKLFPQNEDMAKRMLELIHKRSPNIEMVILFQSFKFPEILTLRTFANPNVNGEVDYDLWQPES